jgi:hypothetical protein
MTMMIPKTAPIAAIELLEKRRGETAPDVSER